jgi:hypothetical protein
MNAVARADGDPSPLSPKEASESSAYEVMNEYVRANYWPSADEVVVRHKASNTFWHVAYRMRADDSDYEMPAKWTQVWRMRETVVKYVPLPTKGAS